MRIDGLQNQKGAKYGSYNQSHKAIYGLKSHN